MRAVGLGVVQLWILDRGFIDGPNISRCKKEFEIDVLISMKKKMDIWEDAWALGKRESWQSFAVPAPKAQAPVKDRPAALARREAKRQQTLAQRRPAPDPAQVLTHREFCGLKGFSSWSQASVPIHVLFMRERYGDGHLEEWGLLTTRDYREVRQPREDYQPGSKSRNGTACSNVSRSERFLLTGLQCHRGSSRIYPAQLDCGNGSSGSCTKRERRLHSRIDACA